MKLKMLVTFSPSCWQFLAGCIGAAAQLASPSRWFHTASDHSIQSILASVATIRGGHRGSRRLDGWPTEFRMTIWEPGGGIGGRVNKRLNVDLCAWCPLCDECNAAQQAKESLTWEWFYQSWTKFKGKPEMCCKTCSLVWWKTNSSYFVSVLWDDPHNSLFLF